LEGLEVLDVVFCREEDACVGAAEAGLECGIKIVEELGWDDGRCRIHVENGRLVVPFVG
jgi:hypothetical protein